MVHFISKKVTVFSEKFLPSPFAITIFLTFLVFVFASVFTSSGFVESVEYWNKGFWELLTFTMQMALILVFGHALASTPIVLKMIEKIVAKCDSTEKAALWVALSSLLMSFLNWGLGLVFGAILARKVAEAHQKKNSPLNYPLIGAAAYSGLIIWHGGFSGSAPLTVATENHFLVDVLGVVTVSETILSWQNLVTTALLLVAIPWSLFRLGKLSTPVPLNYDLNTSEPEAVECLSVSDKIDENPWLGRFVSVFLIVYLVFNAYGNASSLSFINLNFVNMLLLALGLWFHRSLNGYSRAVDDAVRGIGGILLLFPFYAGIMGVMKYSGLGPFVSSSMVDLAFWLENTFHFSAEHLLPLFTFVSSGLVNVFVPSGGGQWAVQGGILSEASVQLGLSLKQMIMAFSYGDELTNMLQPFWALPLLGITKLKAREILPYTVLIMLIALPVFILGIYLF